MLDRRSFLRAGIGIGGGSLLGNSSAVLKASLTDVDHHMVETNDYERFLASLPDKQMSVLGRPRSWSMVRQGFVPFAPERVILLQDRAERSNDQTKVLGYGNNSLTDRVAAALEDSPADSKVHIAFEKPELIVRLTKILTDYYHVPERLERWAIDMARREALGATALWREVGFPHNFQEGERQDVKTDNLPVDWWLGLLPDGVAEWDNLFEEPVHLMVLFIVAEPHKMLGFYINCVKRLMGGLNLMLLDNPNWVKMISQMDRVSAARTMNKFVLKAMQEDDGIAE